jgi:hypothetical protein
MNASASASDRESGRTPLSVPATETRHNSASGFDDRVTVPSHSRHHFHHKQKPFSH